MMSKIERQELIAKAINMNSTSKDQVLESYARSQITEGNATNQLGVDRLEFREQFTIWCLENPDLALQLGWTLHLP